MARRKRGEGSVYQRKDGGWCAQYNGKYKYARSEEEAKKKLYRMLSGEQETKPNNITVGKALETYFEASKANLKPRTIKRYSDVIRVHLSPSLGKVKLKDLDVARIEAVYAKKLSEGLSPATIQGIHAVLSACTKRAVRLRLVERNVCKDVELPKIEREEVEVFSPEEVRAILDEAKRDRLEALYVLALTTGMREGELIGQRFPISTRAKGHYA